MYKSCQKSFYKKLRKMIKYWIQNGRFLSGQLNRQFSTKNVQLEVSQECQRYSNETLVLYYLQVKKTFKLKKSCFDVTIWSHDQKTTKNCEILTFSKSQIKNIHEDECIYINQNFSQQGQYIPLKNFDPKMKYS